MMINNLKNILYWNSYPKDPDMSQELDFPYIPIMGMGCFDYQSYENRENVWILRVIQMPPAPY